MTITYVKGDLFDADTEALAHGCNLIGLMGAGVAVGFRERWPGLFSYYQNACEYNRLHLGDCLPYYLGFDQSPDQPQRVIYNLGTQPVPGPSASLGAIALSVERMLSLAERDKVRSIGIPKIGCGHGGLRWLDVSLILNLVSKDFRSIDLIVYDPTGLTRTH